jgi:tight adherence protein B
MMLAIGAACAILAIWFWVPRPAAAELRARLGAHPAASGGSVQPAVAPQRGTGRWLARSAGVVGTAAALVSAGAVSGSRAMVLAAAALVVGWTVAGLTIRRLAARRADRVRVEVARACAALASYVRIGQVPAEALALAAVDCPVLREAHRTQDLGGDVTRVWRAQAGQPGGSGLLELARAWQVATDTGAPMSATLEQVAEALTADLGLRAVVDSELAAPRATSKVMAALPACGIGLGYLLGGDPVDWLLASPVGGLCLVAGVVLACAGVLWIDMLASAAAR